MTWARLLFPLRRAPFLGLRAWHLRLIKSQPIGVGATSSELLYFWFWHSSPQSDSASSETLIWAKLRACRSCKNAPAAILARWEKRL